MMIKAHTILAALLLPVVGQQQNKVEAHVGRGMPVHHELHARVGQTTDSKPRAYSIYRRSTARQDDERRQYLARSIHDNIHRAAARHGLSLPNYGYEKRQVAYPGHGTTEQSASQLNDPTQECTDYNLPIIGEIESQFPTIWTAAQVLPRDTEAAEALSAINASGIVPVGIEPRGTQPASLEGAGLDENYNLAEDPDCWWTDKMCTTPKHARLLPDLTSCNEPYTWGYTFDDGPNCTHNALYDMWAANNHKASLMYIGSNVLHWPLEAQRGIVDRHHICVHTWSHRYMTSLTTDQPFAELWYTIKVIKYVLGVTPTCWRPPYGDIDDRISGFAQGLGLRTIMWNVDTNDWNIEPYGTIPTPSLRQTYSSIMPMATMPAAATGGVIVLEHELEASAMNMSIEQYPAVKAAWKHVVPLTACLNITNPYPEDITYPDFDEYINGNVVASGLPAGDMAIASTAQVTAQGTLSGMGATFPTAANGAGNQVSSIAQTATPTGSSSASAGDGAPQRAQVQNQGSSKQDSPASTLTIPTLVVTTAIAFGALLIVV